jgi:hypothetical protein
MPRDAVYFDGADGQVWRYCDRERDGSRPIQVRVSTAIEVLMSEACTSGGAVSNMIKSVRPSAASPHVYEAALDPIYGAARRVAQRVSEFFVDELKSLDSDLVILAMVGDGVRALLHHLYRAWLFLACTQCFLSDIFRVSFSIICQHWSHRRHASLCAYALMTFDGRIIALFTVGKKGSAPVGREINDEFHFVENNLSSNAMESFLLTKAIEWCKRHEIQPQVFVSDRVRCVAGYLCSRGACILMLIFFALLSLTSNRQDVKCANQISSWSADIVHLNDIGHGKKNLLKDLNNNVTGGETKILICGRMADTFLRGHKAVSRANQLKVMNIRTFHVARKYWRAVWKHHADAMRRHYTNQCKPKSCFCDNSLQYSYDEKVHGPVELTDDERALVAFFDGCLFISPAATAAAAANSFSSSSIQFPSSSSSSSFVSSSSSSSTLESLVLAGDDAGHDSDGGEGVCSPAQEAADFAAARAIDGDYDSYTIGSESASASASSSSSSFASTSSSAPSTRTAGSSRTGLGANWSGRVVYMDDTENGRKRIDQSFTSLAPYLFGDLVDCFLHPFHTCLLESHWHRRCGLISKNSPVFQARWAFVHSFLLLRNHFGFDAIGMIADEAGFRLPDEVIASLKCHDSRAIKQSVYYKDSFVKHKLQQRRKARAAQEMQNRKRDKDAGFAFHGYVASKVTPSASVAAGSTNRKRKIVADSSSSAASSPSSLSSSPDDTRFFCEVCNSRFEFHSNDFYRQATHYQSKGHKAKNVSYLKKRRSGM